MAARLQSRHQDAIKAKIKVAQIINFLETYALTGKDTGKQEVNPSRIQAAKILLDKTTSNAPTEVAGHFEGVFEIKAPWMTEAAKKRGW